MESPSTIAVVPIEDEWPSTEKSFAFGLPVRIMNDAAMQALGSYEGGRMLFLGLGTGLGSALITEEFILTEDLIAEFYTRENQESECAYVPTSQKAGD